MTTVTIDASTMKSAPKSGAAITIRMAIATASGVA